MNAEELKIFLGKHIIITSQVENESYPRYYTGYIKKLTEETILFEDKFKTPVVMKISNIERVVVVAPDGKCSNDSR